jgi:hypothetical protein
MNTLPYPLTDKLIQWLVRFAVNRIVLVATRNSVDQISLREKLYGRKLNVPKELKHGFGDYLVTMYKCMLFMIMVPHPLLALLVHSLLVLLLLRKIVRSLQSIFLVHS